MDRLGLDGGVADLAGLIKSVSLPRRCCTRARARLARRVMQATIWLRLLLAVSRLLRSSRGYLLNTRGTNVKNRLGEANRTDV